MKDLITRLTESDGYLIARLGSESHRRFAEVISKWDVGMYQQAVLTTLLEFTKEEAPSQRELGDVTGIDPRNLVPIVDSLEERGFIARSSHPNDRRRFAIKLTSEGKALAERILQSGQELEAAMFSCLTEKAHATGRQGVIDERIHFLAVD